MSAGDTVRVEMEVDTAPRTVDIPPELKRALAKNKGAKEVFEKLPPSHKREYVGYITEAKKPETRLRRVNQTIKTLLERR